MRPEFTRTLSDVWQQMADSPDTDRPWLLSYIFTRAILPAGGHLERDKGSKVQLIRDRLRRWRMGECGALWKEAVEIAQNHSKGAKGRKKRRRPPAQEEKSQQEKNVERATKLGQEGQYTRSLQALVSHGLADSSSAAVLAEMKAKHPPGQPPTIPDTDVPSKAFSPSEVSAAVKSFHKGSAPGPSGLRPEHLMVVLKAAPPNRSGRAETQLTRVVNTMVKGKVPPSVSPFLCGARLHAANKKDGGLRPVAVGNLLRRLTSKALVRSIEDKVRNLLSPHQLGVGTRGGCETIVHTVKEALGNDSSKWVLQVDLQNAFNSIDRSKMLAEVARQLPECLPWAVTCYGAPSFLQFGSSTLISSSGVQQGDPFAGDCFAITLQPILEIIEAEVPTLAAHAWFHDDGTAVGDLDELGQVVDIVEREGPALGVNLNADKSSIWCPMVTGPGDPDPLHRKISRVQDTGIKLLGSPIGDEDFVRRFFQARTDKVRAITAELSSLQQPHLEFVLLRSCLALPKIVFMLRTTDTTSLKTLLHRFDSITREALSRILGRPVSDQGWEQAKTPVCMGGLGLRAASDHGDAAYATSFSSSQSLRRKLLKLEENAVSASLSPALLTNISNKLGEETDLASEYFADTNQKAVSSRIDLHNMKLLSDKTKEEGVDREIARLNSLSIKNSHAGDWLNVVPNPGLNLLLQPAEFVAALRYRLGQPVFGADGPCPACGRPSDRLGDHALNCAWQGERIARHNSLRDAIHGTAVAASLAPTKEGRFLLPGQGGKPADILVPHWTGGKDTAYDVTVINPLQSAEVSGAATTPGHALNTAQKRKLDKSWEECHRQGIEFIPIAVESLGAWHPTAVTEVAKLGSALARQNGDEESTTIQRLFQQLSVALMRGNAALLNNRRPTELHAQDRDDIVW